MISEILKNSICYTCNKTSSCIYLRNATSIINHCEEFETEPCKKNIGETNHFHEVPENDYDNYTGICKNCENRNNCMYRNNESVVWHCEEYI